MEARRTVVVLYGGKSTEHEVSCRSARFVGLHLDPGRYHVQLVGIDKAGSWWWQAEQGASAAGDGLAVVNTGVDGLVELIVRARTFTTQPPIVFCMVHGSDGEDGRIQGLCEMLGVPFVGPSCLGSAIGMDKLVAKQLAGAAGVPVVPFLSIRLEAWEKQRQLFCAEIVRTLGEDVFVKPVRGGSSIGIHHVKRREGLEAAMDDALQYCDEVLIEKTVKGREIEIAALGGYYPEFSGAGEIVMTDPGGFYDYRNKYSEGSTAVVKVPAELTAAQSAALREYGDKTFRALRLYGMARIDFFLVGDRFYFNEVNTVPGFTSISQYPQLWAEQGIKGEQLMDKLIELAWMRWKVESRLLRTVPD